MSASVRLLAELVQITRILLMRHWARHRGEAVAVCATGRQSLQRL